LGDVGAFLQGRKLTARSFSAFAILRLLSRACRNRPTAAWQASGMWVRENFEKDPLQFVKGSGVNRRKIEPSRVIRTNHHEKWW